MDRNDDFWDGLFDDPTAVPDGCPGRAATLPPDDDDGETEASLSPGDWWDVGYVDGLYTLRKKPPLDPDREASYREGYAAGALERDAEARRKAERAKLDEERAAWNLPPAGEDDPVPF